MNNNVCERNEAARCGWRSTWRIPRPTTDQRQTERSKLIWYVRTSNVQSIRSWRHRMCISTKHIDNSEPRWRRRWWTRNVARIIFDSLLFPPAINCNENMCSNSIFVHSFYASSIFYLFCIKLWTEFQFCVWALCTFIWQCWSKNKLKRKRDRERKKNKRE